MAEHKHAEVLRAIADGKAVEYAVLGTWVDFVPGNQRNPAVIDGTQWRIKPEPKPDVVRWLNVYDDQSVSGMHLSYSDANLQYMDADGVILCLRWDGETGKLKSAEVLP